ncbi:MAG: amidase [Proteobacteria bacterium]|nr:amidase [Pseudomonadota bacterium]
MMSNLFLQHSIPDIHNTLCRGEVSFSDLVETVKSAIEKHEAETFAWVRYDLEKLGADAEQAFQEGKKLGFLSPLSGIPFGVKDIFNTKAFPTEMGSPAWKDFTPGNNARVVDSLLDAGGLVVGKTVTAEFAVHALNETLNPHDPSRTPGTSSSGSVAAVATGMVPFALASQTAGSIVRPASFCGVWGMKPSFGLIPRTGVLKTTDSLDSIGFVAAHGKSLRPILDHTRVKGPDYPFVYKNVDMPGMLPKRTDRPWRVGFVRTHVWDGACNYAKKATKDLAQSISREQGFEVEEVEWHENFHSAHQVHTTIYAKSLAYYFQNEAKAGAHISEIMREMIADGESISIDSFQNALLQQEILSEQLDTLLDRYDMVLSLGTASDAPLRDQTELPDPSLIWTLCHVPSLAAPTFRSPDGLPFGVQFVTRRWKDYLLLQGVEALIDRGILPCGSQTINR